jgi:hypothetical protein
MVAARNSRPSGSAGSPKKTTSTKAGSESTRFSLMKTDRHDTWRECFAAAITGAIAAHRSAPSPDVVVNYAKAIADMAVIVCEQRAEIDAKTK